jgi:hypothetical protein
MYRFRGFYWDKASLPSKASRNPDFAAPTARMAFAQLGGRVNPRACKQRAASAILCLKTQNKGLNGDTPIKQTCAWAKGVFLLKTAAPKCRRLSLCRGSRG